MLLFDYPRSVHFHETDAAGIIHFSNFFCYAAEAEQACFQELEIPSFNQGEIWVRVHASCDYHHPVTFQDQLVIRLEEWELGKSSISYEFQVILDNEEGNQIDEQVLIATGKIIIVRYDKENDKSIPLSDDIRQKLTQ